MYTQKFHIYNFHSISLWIFSQCLKTRSLKHYNAHNRKNNKKMIFLCEMCFFPHNLPPLLSTQLPKHNSLSHIYNTLLKTPETRKKKFFFNSFSPCSQFKQNFQCSHSCVEKSTLLIPSKKKKSKRRKILFNFL